MKMSDDDVKKYKDLALWLQDTFPDLPRRKPKVWKAFLKHAGGWWNPWSSGCWERRAVDPDVGISTGHQPSNLGVQRGRRTGTEESREIDLAKLLATTSSRDTTRNGWVLPPRMEASS